jgi:hypothetical protein
MSGIGPVVPADTRKPIEEHGPTDRDGRRPPRRPPKPRTDDDLVEVDPHKLDLEA